MAVTLRFARRRPPLARIALWTWGGVAVAAVLPILGALLLPRGPEGGTRSAFASARSGLYALVSRSSESEDALFAVPVDDPSAPIAVATIRHLPGFTSVGATSPAGTAMAVIAADGGSPTHPTGSLFFVDLNAGTAVRALSPVDRLQPPVWTRNGEAVIVSRSEGETSGSPSFALIRVPLGGGSPAVVVSLSGVLGLYPIDFDPQGRLVTCVIDGRGSTIFRDGEELARISRFITRDWRLSPDGESVAYIESNTEAGLRYMARVFSFGEPVAAAAGSTDDSGVEALGVAWRPGSLTPTFGRSPALEASAQGSTSGGFDVPLSYSPDGSALAVQRWTGTSFRNPGKMDFQAITPAGRTSLGPASRFYGWLLR